MVEEEGIIIEVKDDKVLVRPERSDRCEGCPVEYCVPDGSGRLMIEATDPLGAKVGQRIRLEIRERELVWYSFLLYGVPLISLLVGTFGGSILGSRLGWDKGADAFGVILGVGLTGLSFWWVKQYVRSQDKHKSYRPVVVKILNGEG